MLGQGSYSTCCLTQVTHLRLGTFLQLCTASTDGHVAFWSISDLACSKSNSHTKREPRPSAEAMCWLSRLRIHQSSIKAMSSVTLSPAAILVATGGDDGALGFTRLNYPISPTDTLPSHTVLYVPNAHASAINAIAYLGDIDSGDVGRSETVKWHRFTTASNDQKLKTWLVNVNLDQPGTEGFRVKKESKVNSSIADASCLRQIDEGGKGRRLVIAGIGVEIWRIG